LHSIRRLVYRAFLLSICFAAIGQAQAQPGDSSKPAENASSTSTTSTSSANKDKVILKVGDLQITQELSSSTSPIWKRRRERLT